MLARRLLCILVAGFFALLIFVRVAESRVLSTNISKKYFQGFQSRYTSTPKYYLKQTVEEPESNYITAYQHMTGNPGCSWDDLT